MIFLIVGLVCYTASALWHSRKYFNRMRSSRIKDLIDKGIYTSYRPTRYSKCDNPIEYFADNLASKYAVSALLFSLIWPGLDIWDGCASLVQFLGKWLNNSAPKTGAEHEFAMKRLEEDNAKMEAELGLKDEPEEKLLEVVSQFPTTAGNAQAAVRSKWDPQFLGRSAGGFDIFRQQ